VNELSKGFLALRQGLDAALMRNLPGTIAYFYSYELIKDKLKGSRSDLAPAQVFFIECNFCDKS
jgi:hypothetical protein